MTARIVGAVVATTLAALPPAPPLSAGEHWSLRVSNEIAYGTWPLQYELTAKLSHPNGDMYQRWVVFEVVSGPNDRDGDTPFDPDMWCAVPPGLDTCSVSGAYRNSGVDTVSAWVGKPQGTEVQRDAGEGRYAGATDCDHGIPCARGEAATPGDVPEPDITDVTVVHDTRPRAVNDRASTRGTRAVTLNLLDNDTGRDLALRAVRRPAQGAVTWSADGALTYTPRPGVRGVDTFAYTITGFLGSTSSATVSISNGGRGGRR